MYKCTKTNFCPVCKKSTVSPTKSRLINSVEPPSVDFLFSCYDCYVDAWKWNHDSWLREFEKSPYLEHPTEDENQNPMPNLITVVDSVVVSSE